MLKCTINSNGEQTSISSCGNILDLCADISFVIPELHRAVKRNNPNGAEAFRVALMSVLTHPDSPVWDASGKEKDGDEE